MNRLKDKVAVFVGGGSAVASVCLRAYMEEGAKVLQVDVSEKYFERTQKEREYYGPDRIQTFVGACTKYEDMEKAMAFAVEKFGKIDIVINIAGFHGQGHTEDIIRSQWDLAVDVNVTAVVNSTRAVLPYMKAQKSGHIINFASLGGRGPRGVAVSYAATKAANIGLAQSLAVELAPYGINFVPYIPGSLDTSEFERLPELGSLPRKPMPGGFKFGEARPGMAPSIIKDHPLASLYEVAYALVFLGSDESNAVTGDGIDVAGGIIMTM